MGFPLTSAILDDFSRADGVLGANWQDALALSGLLISNRQASGSLGGQASAWKVAAGGSPFAVYIRLDVVPTVGFIELQITSNPLTSATPRFAIQRTAAGRCPMNSSPAGAGNNTTTTLNAGDWMGMVVDASGQTAQMVGYTAVGGAGWASFGSFASGVSNAVPTGYFCVVNITDDAARIGRFGFETLPGGITPQFVHGHGAC